MPTTTSVLSDLHHDVRGSGPPVMFVSGANGDAGHHAPYLQQPEAFGEELRSILRELV
jgi:hypothetical protein